MAPQDCSFAGVDRFSDSGPGGFDNYNFLGFAVPWSNISIEYLSLFGFSIIVSVKNPLKLLPILPPKLVTFS